MHQRSGLCLVGQTNSGAMSNLHTAHAVTLLPASKLASCACLVTLTCICGRPMGLISSTRVLRPRYTCTGTPPCTSYLHAHMPWCSYTDVTSNATGARCTPAATTASEAGIRQHAGCPTIWAKHYSWSVRARSNRFCNKDKYSSTIGMLSVYPPSPTDTPSEDHPPSVQLLGYL